MQHSHSARKRRPIWRPIALAAITGSVLVAMGVGVWATLSATAANTTPESVTTGTLKLTLANNGAGFGQNITNMAPGDAVNRYVDLTNGGTLDGQALTMQIGATGASQLITDAGTSKALRVSVSNCVGGTWNPTNGTCSGTATSVLAATPLSGLASAVTLLSGAVTSGSVTHLQVVVTLPDQAETTVNGTLPTNTIQGQTANLTYTFSDTQRAATTSNS